MHMHGKCPGTTDSTSFSPQWHSGTAATAPAYTAFHTCVAAVATEQYKQAEEGLYSKLVGLLEKASEFRNQAALALNLAASMLAQTSRKVGRRVPRL